MARHLFERFSSATMLEHYLIEDAIVQYAHLFGQEGNVYPGIGRVNGEVAFAIPVSVSSEVLPTTADSATTTSSPTDFSTTNTQVDGVDEADLVETDGELIYQVNDALLTIVDARQPAQLNIATQFSLTPWFESALSSTTGGRPAESISSGQDLALDASLPIYDGMTIQGMYLGQGDVSGKSDRLTVIASGFTSRLASELTDTDSNFVIDRGGQPEVQVTVFDVGDPSAIQVLESSTLEGSLVTSRAIGDEVIVITSHGFDLPAPLLIENSTTSSQSTTLPSSTALSSSTAVANLPIIPSENTRQGTYETEAEYRTRISGQVLDLVLPTITTVDGDRQTITSGRLIDATQVYTPLTDNPWQLTTVSTFDVGNDHLGVDTSTSLATEGYSQTFVSQDYLYFLQQVYEAGEIHTQILKFDLETDELIAQGEVPGVIDSQFSVDEHEGFLRISTTSGFGNHTSNNVYVLQQQASCLNIVGRLEDLAPGERIFSTRFQGDYGFVVTFRQVDPLFTIDLRNLRKPKVLGELKIPGFSEYLQVIEDGHQTLLLGVGRDADPVTGQAGALKVSLFDVTDLANPQEIDHYIFPGDFTSSNALWDHRAITYSSNHNLLAIPAAYYDSSGIVDAQSNLHIFRVDGNNGLTSLGEISHGNGDEDWIQRSLHIEDTLYAISNRQISAHDIPSLRNVSTVQWSGEGIGHTLVSLATGSRLRGGEQDDTLIGNMGRDRLRGGAGVDRIRGGGGADLLRGEDGNDVIIGGNGNDRLWGNAGSDKLLGRNGNDRLMGGTDHDRLDGGKGKDTLKGGIGADRLTGGSGGDRFIIRRTTDSLLAAYDIITDLVIGRDKIDGPRAIAADEIMQLGEVETLTSESIRLILTNAAFVQRGAATFTINHQTFLALNDHNPGFQPTQDAIVKVTGFTGSLRHLSIA